MNTFDDELISLLTGLADQKIKEGLEFRYDGGLLYASDVALMGLPCTLVLAQALSQRLGMGGCGYQFWVDDKPNPVFPVHARRVQKRAFLEVAPFLTEVFETCAHELYSDLVALYEASARVLGYTVMEPTAFASQLDSSGANSHIAFAR